MKLNAGERLELNKDKAFVKVVSGRLEVYAFTTGDVSFRQFFLMTVGEGETAFPALDEFGEISVVLCAVEDAELEETAFDRETSEVLKPLMKNFWLMTMMRAASTICTSPTATGLPSKKAGSGQCHIVWPMEKYMSGSSRHSEAISRRLSVGVSRSFSASSGALCAACAPLTDAP